MRVALLYEHPTWSAELLSRMSDRKIGVTGIDIGDPEHHGRLAGSYDLWVNRINIMPSFDRPATLAAAARHLLLSLEVRGERVFNGLSAHLIGGSKLAQSELFTRLDLHTPPSVGVSDPSDVGPAASRLAYTAASRLASPVLVKPNLGGSGRGIERYDDPAQIRAALAAGAIDLGVDGTGVVQTVIVSEDGFVHRLEILAGRLLYATRQPVQDGVYNYCAADGCAVSQSIEIVEPDPEVVCEVLSIVDQAGADVAGVEYLIDAENGRRCFYDFNPYSNFIAGQNDQLGFDPIDRFIDEVVLAATR